MIPEKINKIIIAKDGFPLETFENSPITNWFRKLFLASHLECKDCYQSSRNKENK